MIPALAPLVAGPVRVPVPPAVSRPRVVTLGDSLTSGHGIGKPAAYPPVLEDRINQAGLGLEVVNAGVSGARRIADNIWPSLKPLAEKAVAVP
jgi:hypothetical protein